MTSYNMNPHPMYPIEYPIEYPTGYPSIGIDPPNPTGSTIYRLTLEGVGYIGSCEVYLRDTLGDPQNYNYYESKGMAQITSLSIDYNYRHQGYGTYLIDYVMKDLYQNKGYRYLELEDSSDYVLQDQCIYRKIGFIYDGDDGHMICNLRHAVCSKLKGTESQRIPVILYD